MSATTVADNESQGYFERNSAWLRPMVGGAAALTVPALLALFDLPPPAWLLWAAILSAALGATLSGWAAYKTDTRSATIVARGMVLMGLGIAAYYCVASLRSVFV